MENLWKIYGSGPVETISQPQLSKMPPEVRLEVWNSSKACYPFVRIPNLLPESNRQCDVNHNDLFCPFFSLEIISGIYHIEFPILIAISRFGKPLHM